MQHVQNGLSKDMTKLGSKVSGPRWEAWGEGVKKKIGLAKQVEASSNNLKASPPPRKSLATLQKQLQKSSSLLQAVWKCTRVPVFSSSFGTNRTTDV